MNNNDTLNYELYQKSQYFIENKGFSNYWKTMYDFYVGKQYKNVQDVNIPKPMSNICRYVVDNKISKICGTPCSLNFTIFDNTKNTIELSQFDKYILNRLQEEEFNYQACENGFVYGTEITYLRWDKDNTTVDGRYVGGLTEEHIEPAYFRVANPYIGDIQKQEWVMFFNAETVGAVKELIEDEEEKSKICPDGKSLEDLNRYTEAELNSKLVTVYTRFFRIDGEVYFEVSTQNVVLIEATPLNPNAKKDKKKLKIKDVGDDKDIHDYDIDNQDMINNVYDKNELSNDEYLHIKNKFYRYPFALYIPRPLSKSVYGKSEIEELIPNQKIINRLDSMVVHSAELTGMGKTIVKSDALKGQKITNDPSQVLVDYSLGNDWGIRRLEPAQMNTNIVNYNDVIISRTRNLHGADEINAEVATTKNLSGVAIQLINEEKNTQIEQAQRRFWNYIVDKAYIRILFYKFYYQKLYYVYKLSDKELKEEEIARVFMIKQNQKAGVPISPMDYPPAKRERVRKFDPESIKEDVFDITIEAGRGTRYSEIVVADLLNNLVLNGGLQNMDYHTKELFFNLYPLIPPSLKSNMKSLLENQKNDEISQLSSMYQQAQAQYQSAVQHIQSLEAQLGVQSQYTKNLEKEFTNKINAQNDIIKSQNKVITGNGRSSAKINMPSAENYTE